MTRSSTLKPFVVPIFIPHAGCPHRCIFCDQNCTTDSANPRPSADQAAAAITRFLTYRRDAGRHTEISFYGGNFLGLPEDDILKLLECATKFIGDGRADGIRFSTRPDTIDEHSIGLLSNYPVSTIELGVQSMNDTVLETSRRGHTSQDVRRAVSCIREKEYRLGLQMMVGLPGDSPEFALATGKAVADLAPDFVRIYPTLILAGSPLARWYRQGRYTPLKLNEAVEQVATLYALFHRRSIPVIRMGLQSTDGLSSGTDLLAGPFHPAFGELVYSALWRNAMQRTIEACGLQGRRLSIRLHPKLISQVSGHNRENLTSLERKYTLPGIELSTDDDPALDRILINGANCRMIK